jgi:hypothetical protein
MLNKIPTDPEILASKVDHVVAKIDKQLFEVFILKAGTGEVAGNKGFLIVVFS